MAATFDDALSMTIVEGTTGPEFQPSTPSCAAGAPCIWSNETSAAQEILPFFKGGLLDPRATRLTMARRPGAYAFRLRSDSHALLTIKVIGAAGA